MIDDLDTTIDFGAGDGKLVATIKGIEDAAKKINPKVQVTSVSADYDLNKQVSQVDSFIAAGVDVIMLNAVDAKAIAPAVKKAQAAGIVVAAFDVSAPGADVTVMTNNVKAGEEACQYLVDHTGAKGNYVILNGPASSSILERVKGCKDVLKQHPDIKSLSDDQNAEGSRDGGLKVFQSLLTRFDKIDAVFAINDRRGARGPAAQALRLHHHGCRWRAGYRERVLIRHLADQGLGLTGSLCHGGSVAADGCPGACR